MEKIEALVDALGKFGEELGNVRSLIGEIEEEVRRHTASLKKELSSFKKSLDVGELNKKTLMSAERQIQERLVQLRREIESLEKVKWKKEEERMSSSDRRIEFFASDLSIASLEELRVTEDSKSVTKPTHQMLPYYFSRAVVESPRDKTNSWQWWMEERIEDEQIDWSKEYADRESLRLTLMVKEGWKRQNSTYDELEDALRIWTGRFVRWQVAKKGRAKNGKALLNVRFEEEDDLGRLYALRKEIAEEGLLAVGEALAYVERKERWKMLVTAERLRTEGRDVEFQNKRICVDGEWWRYYWTIGWRRL